MGYFYFLAVMNKAAVNICAQVLYGYVFSFLLCIEVELLEHPTLD